MEVSVRKRIMWSRKACSLLSPCSLSLLLTSPSPGSLPGAFGAYGLGVGISRIQDTLPPPVYALLSGLNSATVGLIALSAVQLSQKAITDPLTRILVFFGGAAGMLYNALWYFPVLMVAGCLSTIVWDSQALQRLTPLLRRKGAERRQPESPNHQDSRAIGALPTHAREPERELQEITIAAPAVQVPETALIASIVRETVDRDGVTAPGCADIPTDGEAVKEDHANSAAKNRQTTESIDEDAATPVTTTRKGHRIHWKTGTAVVAAFIASFIVIVTLRGTLHKSPLGFQLFANLYLAGTIIFGGGPVVIPLLRSYVVGPGWVSPRDFLLGLAIIQAFPGPNFNFAVYLGTLASRYPGSGINTATGAVIGFLAIFSPGITLHTGFMGIWQAVRTRKWVVSGLRGINATAVGLIYAAVYRLWEIGFLSESARNGSSLGQDPWWLVTAATSYVGGMWFRLEPPVAILLGGVMGMVWYGVQQA